MSLGKQIQKYRELKELSQQALSDALAKNSNGEISVSAQTVSGWERDEYQPDVKKLVPIAKALGTTVGRLLEENKLPEAEKHVKAYSEDKMYTYVKGAARQKALKQTYDALPFMREAEKGRTRKGEQKDVPYIYHPLTMACEALALKLYDDDILTAALLHDVVEDCGVPLEDLPVNEETREIVRLLTKPAHPDPDKRKANEAYFGAIAQNPKAALVKCLDRLNNLSNMALGFTRDRMAEYVDETEEFVLPLREKYRYYSDDFSDASWIIDYHMKSLLEAFKRIL
ncbi:MAG: helix-turn-helix domain-containing protein [Lachnospiraceae bacterium]|nr:helix-turn-helix domain-containing protein [Lachnospiraceae bacterium]